MMDQLIAGFPDQLEEALQTGRAATLRPLARPAGHIYIAGLGGSGIGGDFVNAFVQEECRVPILVRKGYQVPAFAGPDTLAIVSSYSGNTEETLIAYDQLRQQGAQAICVTSGGKLRDKAEADGSDIFLLPGGSSSPRACLGYSLTAQLMILTKLGYISGRAVDEVGHAAGLLRREMEDIRSAAERLARRLQHHLPVIYSEDRMEPVAVRFRQQLNENSKLLSWHHVIPEMNHNELVGWRDQQPGIAVVYLRNESEYPRNAMRMDFSRQVIGKCTDSVIEVFGKGDSFIQRALYLVHLADWVSWYLARLRGVDVVEVRVIDDLKEALGKVPPAGPPHG